MSSSVANLRESSISLPERSIGLPTEFPHGGGLLAAARRWQCEAGAILDLSTGLHPAGAPAWLPGWLQAHAHLVECYPDAAAEPARSALATELGVVADNVLLLAGAQALIEVVFQAMGWRSLAIEVPCYSEPVRCARRAGCRLHPFERGAAMPVADAVWWTSPSNPFGEAKPFPQGWPGVLDESYMAFEARRRLGMLDGVIRLGSLTKNFCIPGLRLGYAIADAAIIRQLQGWLPPWPANTLALQLLPKLLPEADRRDEQVVQVRERLTALLEQQDWQVLPSQAGFVLARRNGAQPDFAAHRILVRRFPEWPQLDGWIRFGLPGSEAAWQRLEEALCR